MSSPRTTSRETESQQWATKSSTRRWSLAPLPAMLPVLLPPLRSHAPLATLPRLPLLPQSHAPRPLLPPKAGVALPASLQGAPRVSGLLPVTGRHASASMPTRTLPRDRLCRQSLGHHCAKGSSRWSSRGTNTASRSGCSSSTRTACAITVALTLVLLPASMAKLWSVTSKSSKNCHMMRDSASRLGRVQSWTFLALSRANLWIGRLLSTGSWGAVLLLKQKHQKVDSRQKLCSASLIETSLTCRCC
mmetsp:Transcript_2855/g.7260  ORF Transcript_2855/g.7260 Transcript_2855/m.7260 type:complete len:247 (-) Transcript_2855:117-857(-)